MYGFSLKNKISRLHSKDQHKWVELLNVLSQVLFHEACFRTYFQWLNFKKWCLLWWLSWILNPWWWTSEKSYASQCKCDLLAIPFSWSKNFAQVHPSSQFWANHLADSVPSCWWMQEYFTDAEHKMLVPVVSNRICSQCLRQNAKSLLDDPRVKD